MLASLKEIPKSWDIILCWQSHPEGCVFALDLLHKYNVRYQFVNTSDGWNIATPKPKGLQKKEN